MLSRAYSQLEIKSLDDEERLIDGIATTPEPDRMGDIVEPKGARYSLPFPLLWQHRADAPIGHVLNAKISDDGIRIKAKIARIDEAGVLKDRLDEAWQSIKAGLVRGLSIGFKPIESEQIKDSFSRRFKRWEWIELSTVTIPMNGDASITAIKAIDVQHLAESRPSQTAGSVRLLPPGVLGLFKPNANLRILK